MRTPTRRDPSSEKLSTFEHSLLPADKLVRVTRFDSACISLTIYALQTSVDGS